MAVKMIHGWGRNPVIKANVTNPLSCKSIVKTMGATGDSHGEWICYGMGRSYGDSALAESIISTKHLSQFLDFDEKKGNLTCLAGVGLQDILQTFVPRGWFLPVTPGTQFVSLGGAIASDVHGKNHHKDGCFSNDIEELEVFIPSQGFINCSKSQNTELFQAVCGGMGLVGIITKVTLKLKPIKNSFIDESLIKAKNLSELLDLIEIYKNFTYSVAWIDCLSRGKSFGRSLLMLGEHSNNPRLSASHRKKKSHEKKSLQLAFNMPDWFLNPFFIKIFNNFYYQRFLKKHRKRSVHYSSFFYPLDSILHWNRIYGKKGFIQYQFVLPKESAKQGITKILQKIVESRKSSFLSVLKAFGPANDNYLSFPMEGLTLALDFKINSDLFTLLNELDRMVLDYGGRVYLAKDARLSKNIFRKTYPKWEQFMKVRTSFGADRVFNSLQSKRLGL